MFDPNIPGDIASALSELQLQEAIVFLSQNAAPFCVLRTQPGDAAGHAIPYSSIERPINRRSGRPLRLIASVNLLELIRDEFAPQPSGVLSLWLDDDFKNYQAKDVNCFSITWQPADSAPPAPSHIQGISAQAHREFLMPEQGGPLVEDSALVNWIKHVNSTKLKQSYLFADCHEKLQQAKLTAAFAANGITYSAARAADSCYEHLVEEARAWKLI